MNTKHTEGPWLKGYPEGGITGPSTPVMTGVTVSESIDYSKWEEENEARGWKHPIVPRNHDRHVIITKGMRTVAIAIGDDGLDAEANARLIAAAPKMLEALRVQEALDEARQSYDDLILFTDDPETEPEYRAEYQRRTTNRQIIAEAASNE